MVIKLNKLNKNTQKLLASTLCYTFSFLFPAYTTGQHVTSELQYLTVYFGESRFEIFMMVISIVLGVVVALNENKEIKDFNFVRVSMVFMLFVAISTYVKMDIINENVNYNFITIGFGSILVIIGMILSIAVGINLANDQSNS